MVVRPLFMTPRNINALDVVYSKVYQETAEQPSTQLNPDFESVEMIQNQL